MISETRIEPFSEQLNEQIQQQSGKDRRCSYSDFPGSLLTAVWSVKGATGTQQHPGHAAFHVVSQYANRPRSEKKKMHSEEKKRPMNVIFLFVCLFFQLAEVGIFVPDMHL